jgi:hypothetical protein
MKAQPLQDPLQVPLFDAIISFGHIQFQNSEVLALVILVIQCMNAFKRYQRVIRD